MYEWYDGLKRKLHEVDVAGIRHIYGEDGPPEAVALRSPAANADVIGSIVTFRWDRATAAERYQVQVRRANSTVFRNRIVGDVDEIRLGGFPDDGTLFRWRVRAGNEHCWGPWSVPTEGRPFTNNSGRPGQVNLISPNHNAELAASEITFSWERALNADLYQLIIIGSDGVFFRGNTSSLDQLVKDFPLDGSRYRWRVRAHNDKGWGQWSETRVFTSDRVVGIQVALDWVSDSSYSDLDLRLLRPRARWKSPGDCYFGNRFPIWGPRYLNNPWLNEDHVSPSGPEIITLIEPQQNGAYQVKVEVGRLFSNSSAAATVRIWARNELVHVSNMNLTESNKVWHVADINWPAGTVTNVNQIVDVEDLENLDIALQSLRADNDTSADDNPQIRSISLQGAGRSTRPLGELNIGDRVICRSWEWEFRRGDDYTVVPGRYKQSWNKPITWIAVAKNHYGKPGVTLMTENIIAKTKFDDSTSRRNPGFEWISDSGQNHWGDSGRYDANFGLRRWLNSRELHSGEGFYRAFSDSFRSNILVTKVPNLAFNGPIFGGNTPTRYNTNDRVYIPSTTELGDPHEGYSPRGAFTTNRHYRIGSVFAYFDEEEYTYPRRTAYLGGTRSSYFTRTIDTNSLTVVSTHGGAASGGTSNNTGVRTLVNLCPDNSRVFDIPYYGLEHPVYMLVPTEIPRQVTLSAPHHNANIQGNVITFRWNAVDYAAGYQVRVLREDGTVFRSRFRPGGNQVNIAGFPENGDRFRWQVRAQNSSGQFGPWSGLRLFGSVRTDN